MVKISKNEFFDIFDIFDIFKWIWNFQKKIKFPNFLGVSPSVHLIPLSYRSLKNVIHQIDSKNVWLLLSVASTAKIELVFVLTFENVFS